MDEPISPPKGNIAQIAPTQNLPTQPNECPLTVALSVASMVFGLIGVFWAMIPCLGLSSLLASIPASIAGLFANYRATKLGLPRTFPVAGLTVAGSGVLIAFLNFLIITIIFGWSL